MAMSEPRCASDRPTYDRGDRRMADARGVLAKNFARQVIETIRPFLPVPARELRVLDIGCGYGGTTIELARACRHIVGIEPSSTLLDFALKLKISSNLKNIEFRNQDIYELTDKSCYDLAVLDNVFEHLPDQPLALQKICECLKPRGLVYMVVPNRLWPVEVHYGLPFLSYLPLRLANYYLQMTGRGQDYTDASYAPTYFRLNRLLRARKELFYHYVLPSDVSLATLGHSLRYKVGVAMIRRFPWLWAISKAFLVVAIKK